jgi:hypothetical protein
VRQRQLPLSLHPADVGKMVRHGPVGVRSKVASVRTSLGWLAQHTLDFGPDPCRVVLPAVGHRTSSIARIEGHSRNRGSTCMRRIENFASDLGDRVNLGYQVAISGTGSGRKSQAHTRRSAGWNITP